MVICQLCLSGKIEETIDSDTIVGALVAFWSGIIDGVTDALDNAGWLAKVGILRFVKAAAAQHSTPELLKSLMEKTQEGDSDVQACYSWAVGEVIRHLGFDAAKLFLRTSETISAGEQSSQLYAQCLFVSRVQWKKKQNREDS